MEGAAMTRWHWSTTVTALVFVLAGFLAWGGPASAEECVTIQEDRAKIEAKGWKWLGIEDAPFTEGFEFVYYNIGGVTAFSPVTNGCVGGAVFPVGPYVPEVNV